MNNKRLDVTVVILELIPFLSVAWNWHCIGFSISKPHTKEYLIKYLQINICTINEKHDELEAVHNWLRDSKKDKK